MQKNEEEPDEARESPDEDIAGSQRKDSSRDYVSPLGPEGADGSQVSHAVLEEESRHSKDGVEKAGTERHWSPSSHSLTFDDLSKETNGKSYSGMDSNVPSNNCLRVFYLRPEEAFIANKRGRAE